MADINQFEQFMRDYQNMVYSTALRLLGNSADAEDISQAVFLKAYQCYDQISIQPTAGGWLKTVATNLCLNHLSRYRSRWRFFSDLLPDDAEGTDVAETFPAPDHFQQQITEGDYREALETAIRKLPAAQRVPLVLFHFEELPYEEIAARLRVSLSKVKTDIHRGRLALKRYLKPDLLEGCGGSHPGGGDQTTGGARGALASPRNSLDLAFAVV